MRIISTPSLFDGLVAVVDHQPIETTLQQWGQLARTRFRSATVAYLELGNFVRSLAPDDARRRAALALQELLARDMMNSSSQAAAASNVSAAMHDTVMRTIDNLVETPAETERRLRQQREDERQERRIFEERQAEDLFARDVRET